MEKADSPHAATPPSAANDRELTAALTNVLTEEAFVRDLEVVLAGLHASGLPEPGQAETEASGLGQRP